MVVEVIVVIVVLMLLVGKLADVFGLVVVAVLVLLQLTAMML